MSIIDNMNDPEKLKIIKTGLEEMIKGKEGTLLHENYTAQIKLIDDRIKEIRK